MNTKTINLDINKKYYGQILAKQGDVYSRFLLFKIKDGANIFTLTNRTVRVYAIKPDGAIVFNDLTITDAASGVCKLELTSQMLAVQGTLLMELYIMEGTKKLTSIPFEIEVIKCINSETAIVSTNEFTALINGLASLNEYDAYKVEIEAARGTYLNLDARLDAHDTQLAEKANNVDNTRTTTAKDVTGALNELNAGKGNYEFGWWNPVLICTDATKITTDSTYSFYIKIGKLVICYFYMVCSSWDTANTNKALLIQGFPFTPSKNKVEVGTINYVTGIKDTEIVTLGLLRDTVSSKAAIVKAKSTGMYSLYLSSLNQSFQIHGKYEFYVD